MCISISSSHFCRVFLLLPAASPFRHQYDRNRLLTTRLRSLFPSLLSFLANATAAGSCNFTPDRDRRVSGVPLVFQRLQLTSRGSAARFSFRLSFHFWRTQQPQRCSVGFALSLPVPADAAIWRSYDCDLQLSAVLHSQPKSTGGTPAYIAPEIADVWSCGVTLYVMLIGVYPFEIVPNLVQTSFLFSLPMDGPMSFSTPHISVQWALRFEFFTTLKNVDWTRYDHPLLVEGRDKSEWVLPITVHAPPPGTPAAHARDERNFSSEPLWLST